MATATVYPHQPFLTTAHSLKSIGVSHAGSTDTLLREIQSSFASQLDVETLLQLSQKLQVELKEHLIASPQCMLPSHNYALPSGEEVGTFLSLEVGGSNLRVASVDLGGRANGKDCLRVRRSQTSPISLEVRRREGLAFFDWMADRIREMLATDSITQKQMRDGPLRMGVSWAFPIDQTSLRSGDVLGMGKGFRCSTAVKGLDLGETIMEACHRAGLNISLDAIVNDTSATLLSRAYVNRATRMAMVLGTGFNAAVHLPIPSLHSSKFNSRTMPSFVDASHVLVNTELSMFGKDAFWKTRWDTILNSNHFMPDYQPMEYLASGRYMGELVRLVMLEATERGLLGGSIPPSLQERYTLDARLLAVIETDNSHDLLTSRTAFQENHPSASPPSTVDARFLQQVIRSVTQRSSAFVTVGVHALASLLDEKETQHQVINTGLNHISIACDGSIINKYPAYMDRCQEFMDQMLQVEGQRKRRVVFEPTTDSAVCGAGIAAAMTSASP